MAAIKHLQLNIFSRVRMRQNVVHTIRRHIHLARVADLVVGCVTGLHSLKRGRLLSARPLRIVTARRAGTGNSDLVELSRLNVVFALIEHVVAEAKLSLLDGSEHNAALE